MKETSTVINYVKIGKKIKKIRLEKELTQEEIASAAEISLSHMSNIETAKTKVSLITLAKISRILECSLDELVFDDKITSNFKLKKILCNVDEFEINIIEVLIKAIEDNKMYLNTTWLWYPALKYSDSKKAVGIQDRISIAFSFKSYNWISV